jgi:nucleotide-binding universal stress UspA family protein
MYKQILCPIDGSPTSNCGMNEAIQLAKNQHAKLRFFHVIDMYFPMFDGIGDFSVVYIDDILRKNAKKVIKKAEMAANKAGVNAESKIVEAIGARVSKYVLEQIDEWPADLVVMGTHGLRGFQRMVMGSDAETIVHNSPIPVMLVKGKVAARRSKK